MQPEKTSVAFVSRESQCSGPAGNVRHRSASVETTVPNPPVAMRMISVSR